MTNKTRSTQRRARAADLAAQTKAREDRMLTQIVAVAVARIVVITPGVGYVVFDATRSKPGSATTPTTQAATHPARRRGRRPLPAPTSRPTTSSTR